jgi:NAD+ kinase
MKVALAGSDAADLGRLIGRVGLEVDDDNPDAIISYGGDGTLLGAERDRPGIPKLAIRHANSARKCPDHEDSVVLARLARGELQPTTLSKIAATAKGRDLIALNDICLEKAIPTSGVRYRVWIGGEQYSNEIVADGLVVASPFGSSAYYRSITRSFFRAGIGVAFNNSTEPVDHLVLREDERLRLMVTRGPARLCYDNAPDPIEMDEGDEAEFYKAQAEAVLLGADTLFCNRCRRPDGLPFNRLGGLKSL